MCSIVIIVGKKKISFHLETSKILKKLPHTHTLILCHGKRKRNAKMSLNLLTRKKYLHTQNFTSILRMKDAKETEIKKNLFFAVTPQDIEIIKLYLSPSYFFLLLLLFFGTYSPVKKILQFNVGSFFMLFLSCIIFIKYLSAPFPAFASYQQQQHTLS